MSSPSLRILVLGATGYIGSRLVPRLIQDGHHVRCLVRDTEKLRAKGWSKDVEAFEGDVLDVSRMGDAFDGVDVVYYLVHSMASMDDDFEALDRKAARNVAFMAEERGVKRIIYLGGLGKRDEAQSAHLQSRHEVGDILRNSGTPVTEFRAAVIVGSGSISFEMIHHLVNRLPVMICPRWVYTRTQPIAVRNVLEYLMATLGTPGSIGKTIDIGGPRVLTYGEMMNEVGRVLGFTRLMIPVPVLTPRLSSYWVNLVTPIPAQVARPLIEGLRYETVCENDLASTLFDIKPMELSVAVERALSRVAENDVESVWTDAASFNAREPVDSSHLLDDKRETAVNASPAELFHVITSIGGTSGWYYADWLWRIRGFIDKQLGGVGLRRGRRHPVKTSVGEALDFWRVEEYDPPRRLRLRAEMKVWGQAWLQFDVADNGDGRSRLCQTAEYYPRGVIGIVYWYSIYVIHAFVFRGLIRSIKSRAEQLSTAGDKHPTTA